MALHRTYVTIQGLLQYGHETAALFAKGTRYSMKGSLYIEMGPRSVLYNL